MYEKNEKENVNPDTVSKNLVVLPRYTPTKLTSNDSPCGSLYFSLCSGYCIFIQVFGIIPVIMSRESGNHLDYESTHMALMVFAICMASVNTVYNAKVVKELTLPIAIQNTILYSFGVIINLIFYLCSKTDPSNNQHFFYGYKNPGVILLLVLNSFVGIVITVIYKYGDAVLKTLTGPLSSAILVYLSYIFFDMSLDIVKAAGAAVVVVDTLLYLSLPSAPKPDPLATSESLSSSPSRHKCASKLQMRVILVFFVMAGFQLITVPDTGFLLKATPETLVHNKNLEDPKNGTVQDSLPIVLIIQALRMEDPGPNANPKARQINKEKLNIFEAYRPYFRHMIIDSPLYPGEKDACSDPAFEGLGLDCRYCSYTRPLSDGYLDDHRYACAGEIIQDLQVLEGDLADDVMGALVIHADMYLLPAFIPKTAEKLIKYPDSFWLADYPNGRYVGDPLNSTDELDRIKMPFTNGTVPMTRWHWPRDWPRVEAFRDDLTRYLGLADRVTIPSDPRNWADLYYTPKALWQHFVPFARIMMKHGIMNEIAIPLVHLMITDMYGLDRGVPQVCLGGTDGDPFNDHLQLPEQMSEIPCGHRFDLIDPLARDALLHVWRQQPPPVSLPVNMSLPTSEDS